MKTAIEERTYTLEELVPEVIEIRHIFTWPAWEQRTPQRALCGEMQIPLGSWKAIQPHHRMCKVCLTLHHRMDR